MERVTEDRTFTCESGPVRLGVRVGEGQTGAISVYEDGDRVGQAVDTLEGFDLGECGALADAAVTVRATVNVVHQQSGRTSLTCAVHCDGQEHRETFPGPELEVGGAVLFKIRYTRG